MDGKSPQQEWNTSKSVLHEINCFKSAKKYNIANVFMLIYQHSRLHIQVPWQRQK